MTNQSEFLNTINEELTIVVCGPVDAGKSTIIGVLTSGELDDGRGFARNKVLTHPHEIESGRTSNITFNPLIYKFKSNNDSENYGYLIEQHIFKDGRSKKGVLSKKNIFKISYEKLNNEFIEKDRITSFVDLAGHEKYLKTTVFGVSGLFPNYGLIIIGSNTGITKLTREHIGILYYLNIPFIICITKIDLSPRHVYQKLCNKIKQLLGSNVYKKVCYFISDSENNDQETKNYMCNLINNHDIVPVISISNKSGINIDNLHKIISHIKIKNKWIEYTNESTNDENKSESGNFEGSIVYIDSNFLVPGIGLVVSGSVKGNTIKVKDKMYIGPKNGQFYPLTIRSIHNTISQNIQEAYSESQSCFAIKFINSKNIIERKEIKKGMVLIDDFEKWKKNIVKKFKAKITVLQHSTTIKNGYSPVIHCGPVRQSARLDFVKKNQDESNHHIRSGDTEEVYFTFSHHSEFLEKNRTFFFMDGNTKGVGKVTSLM